MMNGLCAMPPMVNGKDNGKCHRFDEYCDGRRLVFQAKLVETITFNYPSLQ